jgi:hypothetical protein
MSVFVENLAGRAGMLLQHGVAVLGFHLRHPFAIERPQAAPAPRSPGMDPEIMRQLLEAARTVGKLDWSRRYTEIVGGQPRTSPGPTR